MGGWAKGTPRNASVPPAWIPMSVPPSGKVAMAVPLPKFSTALTGVLRKSTAADSNPKILRQLMEPAYGGSIKRLSRERLKEAAGFSVSDLR
jgi:hypothetical protein